MRDTKGRTQGQKRLVLQERAKQQEVAEKLSYDVGVLLNRAKKLGLAGTDLIRLAQCEASGDVVKAITSLVYAGQSAAGIRVAKSDVDELELYRSLEFDEFEGLEFIESKKDFDHDDSGRSM